MLVALHVNLTTSDTYQGLHVLLVTEDDGRGKALTKALRDHHARVSDLTIALRDPAAPRGVDLILLDQRCESTVEARLAELRSDVRARWASLVKVDYEELIKSDGSVHLHALTEQVAPLVEVDRKLTARAREESTFSTSLAPLGPSRTLRALSLSGHTLLVELRHATLSATIEVANELLVSASAARAEKRWEAWSALVRILGLLDAEVMVARRSFTAAMNIMEPVDQALEVAAQERHCSAAQIAAEEAEAERLAQLPKSEAPPPPDPRGNARGPGYAPPRPQARASMPAGGPRTLLGIATPGAPAAGPQGGLPKPFDKAQTGAAPALPEAPRYAQRAGGGAGRLNMTLLGMAPGSVPGLAELRAQAERERADKATPPPESTPPASAEEETTTTRPSAPEAEEAPVRPGESLPDLAADIEASLGERELPGFDAPTARPSASEELLDDLDELTMVAAPLSPPLPPPRATQSANDNDVALAPAAVSEPTSPTARDVLAETSPTPTDLRSHLLAKAGADALAETERPPSLSEVADLDSDLPDHEDDRLTLPSSSTKVAAAPGAPANDTTSASAEPNLNGSGEHGPLDETLVVKREPAPKRKAPVGRWLSVGALLAAIGGLVGVGAIKAGRRVPQTTQESAAETSAQASPARDPGLAAASAPSSPSSASQAAQRAAVEGSAPGQPSGMPQGHPSVAPGAAAPPEPGLHHAAHDSPSSVIPPLPSAPAVALPQDTALPAQGGDLSSLLKQAQRHLLDRQPAQARALFEQALSLDAGNPHVRAGLAESLLKSNEPAAALPHALIAVKLRPKRGRYQLLLGDVLAAQGKTEEAQAAFRKALELDPADLEAKQRLTP